MNKKDKNNSPVPTGNPWQPDEKDPATVPVPLPVVMVKVEGPFTERDRKLWTFLVHAVWDDLETKRVHELKVTEISRVFRECGSDHNSNWVWDSAARLVQSRVIFESITEEERYRAIASLLGAVAVGKKARETGYLHFEFPAMLVPVLKNPQRFARLRTHFLLGLSGKYSVTLYELLEAVVNKVDPSLTVTVDQIRTWLKVPEGKLTRYVDLRRFALEPSLKQINSDPIGAGFTVDMQPIKKGRAVHKLCFTVCKTDGRKLAEAALKQGRSPEKTLLPVENPNHGPLSRNLLRTDTYEKAKKVAPGYDVYVLEMQWREWMQGKKPLQNLDAAFIAFCRQKYQRQGKP